MQECNLSLSAEEIEKLNSVDNITSVLRSIFYHDTLQSWKRWTMTNNRWYNALLEANATRTGPLAQFQERYIYSLSRIVPFTHPNYNIYSSREERKGFELNILKLQKAQNWFKTGRVQLEFNNLEQLQQVINKVWSSDLEAKKRKEAQSLQGKHSGNNFLIKLKNFFFDVFPELGSFLLSTLGHNRYHLDNFNNQYDNSVVNPMSSFFDRFSLHNSQMQKQMFIQNSLFKHPTRSVTQESKPIQSFYLNPEYRDKVFDIPPRSNITIPNAVFFEPQVIEQKFSRELEKKFGLLKNKTEGKHQRLDDIEKGLHNRDIRATPMQLLVKNNLTIIEPIALKGFGSSGVLELKEIKKRMIGHPKLVPVSQSLFVNISKLIDQLSPYSHLHTWNKLTIENKTYPKDVDDVDYETLFQRKHQNTLHSLFQSTDLYLTNYLFDRQAVEECERLYDDTYQPILNHIVDLNIQQKNYFKKKDRMLLSLQMQNFKNYIPFNIPITDVFLKENGTSYFAFNQSQMLDCLPVSDDNQTVCKPKLEQDDLVQAQFKKMLNYVGKPDESNGFLRQQIAQGLNRFDHQDYRVDLNWTDFEYHVYRNKVKFQREHTRFIEFTNSGTLPVRIAKIMIDQTKNNRCSDFWNILKVVNCKDLIGMKIEPNETVWLELEYYETFQFQRNSKVLTIETESFTQNFYIDFQISPKTQSLAHRLKSEFFSEQNQTEGMPKLVQITQVLFFFTFIYIVIIVLMIIKRVFDDQIMTINKIFPILDTKRVKLKVKSKLNNVETKEAGDIDFTSSVFCSLGGTEILGSLLTSFDILEESMLINQKVNSLYQVTDFTNMVCHQKHFTDVVPLHSDPLNESKFVPAHKGLLYQSYSLNKMKFKQSSSQYLSDALAYCHKKHSVVSEVMSKCVALKQKNMKQMEARNLELIIKNLQQKSPEEKKNTLISVSKSQSGHLVYKVDTKDTIEPPQKVVPPTLSKKQKKQLFIQQQQEKAREEMLKKKQVEEQQARKAAAEAAAQAALDKAKAVINSEPEEKKPKIKKLTKAELKKKEQRLKKEMEIAENTKLIEQAQLEQQIREQRIKELRDKQLQAEAERIKQEEELELQRVKNLMEHNAQLQIDEEQQISIKSYHSSEEKRKQDARAQEQQIVSSPAKLSESVKSSNEEIVTSAKKHARPFSQQTRQQMPLEVKSPAVVSKDNPKTISSHVVEDQPAAEEVDSNNDIIIQPQEEQLSQQQDSQSQNQQPPSSSSSPSIAKATPQSEHSNSDSDLPLFQQKKYLKIEQELQQQKKEEVRKVEVQSQQLQPVQQQEKQKVAIYDSTKAVPRKVVYEKPQPPPNQNIYAGLIHSKNPKADFNNPNNPNYKGRLAGKLIADYLPKAVTKADPSSKQMANISSTLNSKELEYDNRYSRDDYHEDSKLPKKRPNANLNPKNDGYSTIKYDDQQAQELLDYRKGGYRNTRVTADPYYEETDRYYGGGNSSNFMPPEDHRYGRFQQTDSYYQQSYRGMPIRGQRQKIVGGKQQHIANAYSFEEMQGYRSRAPYSKYYTEEDYYYDETPSKYEQSKKQWEKSKAGEDSYYSTQTPIVKRDKSKPKIKHAMTTDRLATQAAKAGGGTKTIANNKATTSETSNAPTHNIKKPSSNSKYDQYQFKPKEKDSSQYHIEARSGSTEDKLKPKAKYVIKSKPKSETTDEGVIKIQSKPKLRQRSRSQSSRESGGEEGKDDEDYDVDALQSHLRQALAASPQVSESNNNDTTTKSLYQTFMDVSSIFSKNFKTMGQQQPKEKAQSRFLPKEPQQTEPVLDEEEDSIYPSIFGRPFFSSRKNSATYYPQKEETQQQNTGNKQPPQNAKNSIFNQNNLFGSNAGQNQYYHSYDKNAYEYPVKSAANHDDPFIYTEYGTINHPEDFPAKSQNTGAGLASSSFAKFRKRALQEETKAEQTSKVQTNSFQPTLQFQGLGSLPIPQFLQGRKRTEINSDYQFNQPQCSDEEDSAFKNVFQTKHLPKTQIAHDKVQNQIESPLFTTSADEFHPPIYYPSLNQTEQMQRQQLSIQYMQNQLKQQQKAVKHQLYNQSQNQFYGPTTYMPQTWQQPEVMSMDEATQMHQQATREYLRKQVHEIGRQYGHMREGVKHDDNNSSMD